MAISNGQTLIKSENVFKEFVKNSLAFKSQTMPFDL